MTAPEDTITAAPAKHVSLWEDFVDIFVSPSEVFERRRNSGFFLPLIVFTALTIVLAILGRNTMQAVFDAEYARSTAAAMKANPQVTADQMDKARQIAEKFIYVGLAFGAFIVPIIVGFVLWLVGKLVDAKEGLQAACMIATYAYFPKLIEGIINIFQGFILDPATINGRYRITLGLGRFLDPDTTSPVVLAILGRIDVFTIWVTVLLVIGLAVVARIPKSRAVIAGVLVWLVGMLPGLLGALRQT